MWGLLVTSGGYWSSNQGVFQKFLVPFIGYSLFFFVQKIRQSKTKYVGKKFYQKVTPNPLTSMLLFSTDYRTFSQIFSHSTLKLGGWGWAYVLKMNIFPLLPSFLSSIVSKICRLRKFSRKNQPSFFDYLALSVTFSSSDRYSLAREGAALQIQLWHKGFFYKNPNLHVL